MIVDRWRYHYVSGFQHAAFVIFRHRPIVFQLEVRPVLFSFSTERDDNYRFRREDLLGFDPGELRKEDSLRLILVSSARLGDSCCQHPQHGNYQ